MSEAELIQKIRLLKKIRPRKNWVLLTKRGLFQEEIPTFKANRDPFSVIFELFPRLALNYKFALATFIFLGILASGAFSVAQRALPGDFLYSVKRIAEKGQAIFVSETERPKVELELANKRLEELTQVAEKNQVQKLAPAINEFQQSVSQVAKNLREPKKITKDIVEQTKKLTENKEKVEALGVVVGETEEFESALKELVLRELQDLEGRTLTDEQTAFLEEAKESFENGDFVGSLEKIWLLSNQ